MEVEDGWVLQISGERSHEEEVSFIVPKEEVTKPDVKAIEISGYIVSGLMAKLHS